MKTLLQGYGKPTGQPFIPGWLGYDPETKPFPYDPAQAKKLVAAASNEVDRTIYYFIPVSR